MEDHEVEIYKKSKDNLLQILDLNLSAEQYLALCHQNQSVVWKVLVLDEYASSVLSPLVHVTDLRMHNIPIYLSLHAKREALRAVTVIYLVEPSLQNIQAIVKDCKNQLYDYFQINFIYPPPENIIQALATGLAEEKAFPRLNKIYEQYTRYVVLEPKLFTLSGPSFYDLNQPGISDLQIELKLEEIAMSLFCLMKNCKIWPIIKTGKGMCDEVLHKLQALCDDTTEDVSTINRPLLLIIDRSIDLSIMFHHSWTYQSLLLDVFKNSMNKIAIPSAIPSITELDKGKDSFWSNQSFQEFDLVLQNIDKQFNEWKAKYDSIGTSIVEAFENVTELTEKKSQLDLHMMLASELVKIIKTRHLDHYNQCEETLMRGKNSDIEELLQLPVDCEEAEIDKLRLKIISFLSSNREFEGHTQLFHYLRSYRIQNSTDSTVKYLVGFAGKMKDKLMGFEKMLPLTKLLHSAMENKEKGLEYFDTKFRNGLKYKREFTEAIVFVIGGGSYSEYQNLMQYGESCGKNIIYGATSMIPPNDFFQQVKNLSEFE